MKVISIGGMQSCWRGGRGDRQKRGHAHPCIVRFDPRARSDRALALEGAGLSRAGLCLAFSYTVSKYLQPDQ